MAYQSLYRRYRPSRFSQVRGQSHVIPALLNAVRNDSVTHAYLFSGPRGTGKTSTARILAKALNCENPQDGEPCGECQSCLDMEAGRSFDLFELDAASNNGVDAIRDLTERAAVGSPGRTKVYILDEVHMLSPAASNALLKTLEEPPPHVRFVLATTDPQKVLPTIKSRTQHFEFQLLSADELEEYVRWIAQDAHLDLDDESIRWAVRQGRGSARDTLSALDQVVAAGGVVERAEPVEQLLEALAAKNPGTAIVAVADALGRGHDPRVLGRALLDMLRDLFLVSLDASVPHLVPDDLAHLRSWADRLGTALLTRSMEAVGTALVEMRQAADPRVPLEVALVRLSTPGSDSVAELVERIEHLEAALEGGAVARSAGARQQRGAPAATGSPSPAPERETSAGAAAPMGASGDSGLSGPARARAELARQRAKREGRSEPAADGRSQAPKEEQGGGPLSPPPPVPPGPRSQAPPVVPGRRTEAAAPAASSAAGAPAAPSVPPAAAPPAAPAAAPAPPASPAAQPTGPAATGALDVDALNSALVDAVLPELKGVARSLYSQGSFSAVEGDTAVFTVENAPTRDRAEKSRANVEALLARHFGHPVNLRLVAGAVPQPAGARSPSTPQTPAARPERSGKRGSPPTDDRGPANGRPPRTPDRRVAEPPTVPSPPRVPEPAATAPEPPPADEGESPDLSDDEYLSIDVSELEDATGVAQTGLERVLEAFPGSTVIQSDVEAR